MGQPKSKSLMIERLQTEHHWLLRQERSHSSKRILSQDIPTALPYLRFLPDNPYTHLTL
jgi:hypothetical protein